ncbi:MAG: high-potential iron-sulfur protein [Pseudomonadota bacterium]
MTTKQQNRRGVTRRDLLAGSAATVAAIPLSAIALRSAYAQDLAELTGDDPAAQALGYVADAASIADGAEATFKAGSNCANCQLYTGGDAEQGPCSIFPGKAVSAKGWCRTWVQKAG